MASARKKMSENGFCGSLLIVIVFVLFYAIKQQRIFRNHNKDSRGRLIKAGIHKKYTLSISRKVVETQIIISK